MNPYNELRRHAREHHVAMQAIFVAFYNFCRKHETLKGKTPAMSQSKTLVTRRQ